MSDVPLYPIGRVRSPYNAEHRPPPQGPEHEVESVIELDSRWQQGLEGLAPGDHFWVLCHFDQAGPPKLKVHPRGDRSRPLTGMFNSRSPHRPNPISLTLVRLLKIEGCRLTVQGLEMMDGTPVLDIKPYVPGIDQPQERS
ncbi:MAG: tRNA (N6-threonylcarbamoyladenosine(37)-N6)-methyltransferase TrmO [Desulfarculaceae bacterium]